MNVQFRLTEEAIREGIARRATTGGAQDLRGHVLAATAAVPQRRGWLIRVGQVIAMPERRTTRLLVIAVVLLATALGAALVGQMLLRMSPPGRLAFISNGDVYVAGPAGEAPRLVWDISASGGGYGVSGLAWLDADTVRLVTGELNSPNLPDGTYLLNVSTGVHRFFLHGSIIAVSPDRRVMATSTVFSNATPPISVRLIEIATGAIVGEVPGSMDGLSLEDLNWSPDGRSFVAEATDAIYRVDIATGERTALVTGLCCGLGPAHAPIWSPDGTRIVYVDYHPSTEQSAFAGAYRDCSFRCGTLWSVDAAGGAPTRLTPELGSETDPAFSPDGRWIAYLQENIRGNQAVADLAVIAADGSGPRDLTPPWVAPREGLSLPNRSPFSWDPDSMGISFVDPLGALWLIKLDGQSTRIATPPISEFAWEVTP